MSGERERLAEVLAEHVPGGILTGLRDEFWIECSCGERPAVTEGEDGRITQGRAKRVWGAHVADALLAAGVRTAEQVAQIEAERDELLQHRAILRALLDAIELERSGLAHPEGAPDDDPC